VPLLLAAAARGDALEAGRLTRTAPRVGYELPDYYGLSETLLLLTLSHLAD
jgi:hypothetical protein